MAAAPQWPGQGETNEEPVASKVAAAASSLLSSATGGSTHQMETEQYDDAEYNSTTPTATTAAASVRGKSPNDDIIQHSTLLYGVFTYSLELGVFDADTATGDRNNYIGK